MQSRLAAATTRVLSISQIQDFGRGVAYIQTRHLADPSIYTAPSPLSPAPPPFGVPQDTENVANPNLDKEEREHKSRKETEPLVPPKPIHPSSPRLEIGAYNPLEPIYIPQKRNTTIATPAQEASCAGLDGTPWPREKEKEYGEKKVQEVENREYYKHHKASPLSEIKMVDTRKPITRATDGTAVEVEYVGAPVVVWWRPEQLDTAEEALERAIRIWRQNAVNGDPDTPHGRVLRALRGEL